jgi:hypothetical protein
VALTARAAGASLAAGGLAWLLWAGCGKSQNGAPRAPPLDAHVDHVHVDVDAAGGAANATDARTEPVSDAPLVDSQPPYPGAAPCPGWPGWYASPNMPPGCFAACIPDNVQARVPALRWDARDDWCPGCKWLEPTWWPGAAPDNADPVLDSLQALGSQPNALELEVFRTISRDKDDLVAIWNAEGQPVAAIANGQPITSACANFRLMTGQDATIGAWYVDGIGSHQRWMLRPIDHASELMLATKPTYQYAQSFVGQQVPDNSAFTANWIVDRFPGFMDVVDVKNQTVLKVNNLPGALPGEYDDAIISGNTIFVSRFSGTVDWSVIQNGALVPFLGGPNVTIDAFATDGKWIVWNEGTNLVEDPSDPERMIPQRLDLYRSPFTTDPTQIQRQLLVPNTHQLGLVTFANGHLTGPYFRPGVDASAGVKFDAFVVDVETGQAWQSELPQDYVWGTQNYPTATELWGTIAPDRSVAGYAYTVARVPYADMQQIQGGMP